MKFHVQLMLKTTKYAANLLLNMIAMCPCCLWICRQRFRDTVYCVLCDNIVWTRAVRRPTGGRRRRWVVLWPAAAAARRAFSIGGGGGVGGVRPDERALIQRTR